MTYIFTAKLLNDARLAKTDVYTAMSLWLRSAFGLRREENIKIVPAWVDAHDGLNLKDRWTKVGKYREIAIRAPGQCTLLNEASGLPLAVVLFRRT
ncbi:integrase domain-containing protein [Duganella sp. HH101]|uniref:integrase domain-containing protein n=1 Tax=Duganella sp. HH101 TaxID=1781066 RepID=UPI000873938E|nr:integrase domain-containing protein [Duganella sp. HH101]